MILFVSGWCNHTEQHLVVQSSRSLVGQRKLQSKQASTQRLKALPGNELLNVLFVGSIGLCPSGREYFSVLLKSESVVFLE